MAFLYRRDLALLGYDIELRKIKKKRLFSVVAYADIITVDQAIQCIATFFKFGNGVRVDYILDKDEEDQTIETYILFMKQSRRWLIELLFRHTIKFLAYVCEFVALVYILYALKSAPPEEIYKIFSMFVCLILTRIVRYLLDII